MAATPEQVWSVLTDVTRIGEWSHETRGGRWLDEKRGIGARFRGENRAGWARWTRPCTVIEHEEPRRFGYTTDGGPLFRDRSEWKFELVPVAGGTRIVQRFRILRLPRWFEAVIVRMLPEHQDRSAALAADLLRLGEAAAPRS